MRVLVFAPFYLPDVGGIETLCGLLHPRLRRRGIDVTVVSGPGIRTEPGVEVVDGVPVHRLELRDMVRSGDPRRIAGGVARVAEIRAEVGPDVVHVHLSGPEVLFHALTNRSTPTPDVISVHNGPAGFDLGAVDGLYRRALRGASAITAVSASVRSELVDVIGGSARRCRVIPNGVELTEPGPDRPIARFALIGRLVHQKAPGVAVEALAEVVGRGRDAHLTIAGDGPERSATESLAADLDVADRVSFAGSVDRAAIDALLRTTSAVVLPSRWEGLPMTALEALAAGVPILATAVHGLGELVVDGVSGWTVPVDDASALADAMTAVVDDPAEARERGRAGRRRVAELHGIDRCVDSYAALYEEVAGS